MSKRNVLRRFATLLSALAVATVLWGCGQSAPTGVDFEQSLEPASAPNVTLNADNPQWW